MMYAEDGELCHDPSNISGGMISKQKLKRSHPAWEMIHVMISDETAVSDHLPTVLLAMIQ